MKRLLASTAIAVFAGIALAANAAAAPMMQKFVVGQDIEPGTYIGTSTSSTGMYWVCLDAACSDPSQYEFNILMEAGDQAKVVVPADAVAVITQFVDLQPV